MGLSGDELRKWREATITSQGLELPPEIPSVNDVRTPFQKDRDKILYCSSFRRLAEITQVVSPDEGFSVHNRLTHVLKVAQIGRRLSEALIKKTDLSRLEGGGGLDPEVVETACLAHDLGHPPFGHLAEEELDKALALRGLTDGFEGNAQTFRVVTKLESTGTKPSPDSQTRSPDFPGGLHLTRATLNAIMKYPWPRGRTGKQHKKWNAYDTEENIYKKVREGWWKESEQKPTLEAQIMDWADDLAYGVHDFEDFYRLGIIPANELKSADFPIQFVEKARIRLHWKSDDEIEKLKKAAQTVFSDFPVTSPYDGTISKQGAIKSFANGLISEFMRDTTVDEMGNLVRPPATDCKITVLKQLTWHFVIEGCDLAIKQHGQKHIISKVLDTLVTKAETNSLTFFKPQHKSILQGLHENKGRLNIESDSAEITLCNNEILRVSADIISGLSERQITNLYERLTGVRVHEAL